MLERFKRWPEIASAGMGVVAPFGVDLLFFTVVWFNLQASMALVALVSSLLCALVYRRAGRADMWMHLSVYFLVFVAAHILLMVADLQPQTAAIHMLDYPNHQQHTMGVLLYSLFRFLGRVMPFFMLATVPVCFAYTRWLVERDATGNGSDNS